MPQSAGNKPAVPITPALAMDVQAPLTNKPKKVLMRNIQVQTKDELSGELTHNTCSVAATNTKKKIASEGMTIHQVVEKVCCCCCPDCDVIILFPLVSSSPDDDDEEGRAAVMVRGDAPERTLSCVRLVDMRCKILRRLVVDRCGDQAKLFAVHNNRVRSEAATAVAPAVGGSGHSTADGTVGDGEEEDVALSFCIHSKMANEITDPTLYEKENQASILSLKMEEKEECVSSPPPPPSVVSQNRASK